VNDDKGRHARDIREGSQKSCFGRACFESQDDGFLIEQSG
jgi:hypothetical protein